MKLAIMQPYIFPYIGYFSLINAVDCFVFYDDVNFIKKGWINRNQITNNGISTYFTIPLVKQSQNSKINETFIQTDSDWKNKIIKSITHEYKKAKYFESTIQIIENVFSKDVSTINELCKESIISVCSYLNMEKIFINSSSIYENHHLKGESRILDICIKEGAHTYINPIGGIDLYNKSLFKSTGIQLYFLKQREVDYSQPNKEFVPWLSIIDVLMFNSISEIKEMFNQIDFL